MGLIDLQTDLKSLKYSTVPGNGTGPYIQKDIDQNRGFSKSTSTDIIFPGGSLFSQKIGEDVERIEKWFEDGANREAWAAKQAILQGFNKPLDSPLGPIANIPDVLGANVLANIAASPLGIHLYNRGIAGFIPQDNFYQNRPGNQIYYTNNEGGGYGIANSGKRSFEGDKTKQDRINLLAIKNVDENGTYDILDKDLIKFGFRVINNDNPSKLDLIQFRAYLTNISDNFNPQWDSIKYIGRGEEFYNYTGFSRDVSFNFKIAALSKEELIPVYSKLNYLASTTSPDYTPDGYLRGNIIKLTIGDYISNQPGVITSLNVSLVDGVWDIDKDRQFTHVVDASVSMKLIHNGLPEKGYNFISNNKIFNYDEDSPYYQKINEEQKIQTFNTNVPLGSEGAPLIDIPGVF